MKRFHWPYFAGLVAGLLMTACEKAPQGDNVIITDEILPKSGTGQSFLIDTANSWVRLSGAGVGKGHPATFHPRFGKVTANSNEVTSGNFVLDIASMQMAGQEEISSDQSKPHLLTGDTLDAAAYGTSQFELTGIEPYKAKDEDRSLIKGANFMISGNLQVGSVTKNITFPARVDLDGNTLKANADFDIDRRQWQLNYGKDKTLDKKSASETMNVELSLVARPEDQVM
jgi:polyisoprenoid-binding protein YceI